MKKILITGSNGQLGREFHKYFKNHSDYNVKYTSHSISEVDGDHITSLDITDLDQVRKTAMEFIPEIIINCGAFTAVDLCETEQEKAYQINAIGPKNLAIVAEEISAELVHFSTDYVYDGLAKEPYIESATPNPQSVYGKTKLAGDQFVQEICKKYYIIRIAWVYGDGKNFVRTMLQLAENHETVRVVSDQIGTPTSTKELVKMTQELLKYKQYGIYHGTCEGFTSWYEFAKMIFQLAGKPTKVEAITTDEYKTAAKRPSYSVLENKKLNEMTDFRMKDWKEALQEFMN